MMSILTSPSPLLPALSIHIFLTVHLFLLPSLSHYTFIIHMSMIGCSVMVFSIVYHYMYVWNSIPPLFADKYSLPPSRTLTLSSSIQPPPTLVKDDKSRTNHKNHFGSSGYHGIDKKLLVGAVCFGCGWGLGGICPAPAITTASVPSTAFIFIPSMLFGMYLTRAW